MIFKKKLFTAEQEQRLLKALQDAELKSSGEIRVHIEDKLSGDAVEACQKKFEELNMHQTKYRNGILFYLAVKSKAFAVWGDEGIHQKVTHQFWDSITELAIAEFKNNNLIGGLEKSIISCGEQLVKYFPLDVDDKNELSNEISY